jgi:hypothetical protein
VEPAARHAHGPNLTDLDVGMPETALLSQVFVILPSQDSAMVMLRLILITVRGIVRIKMINLISPHIYEFF